MFSFLFFIDVWSALLGECSSIHCCGQRYCHLIRCYLPSSQLSVIWCCLYVTACLMNRFNTVGKWYFSQIPVRHYNDVIMTTIASQITSLAFVYSTVYSDADQRKHQSSASLAFVWGIHRDRWIPRTKGQLRGKCFHLMTSSWKRRISRSWQDDKSRFHVNFWSISRNYHEKYSVNITNFRLKMIAFINSSAKRDNFGITTGIANHDFVSIFGRFHVFTHEKPLFHVPLKTFCLPKVAEARWNQGVTRAS